MASLYIVLHWLFFIASMAACCYMLIPVGFACLIAYITKLKNLYGFLDETQSLFILAYLLTFIVLQPELSYHSPQHILALIALSWLLIWRLFAIILVLLRGSYGFNTLFDCGVQFSVFASHARIWYIIPGHGTRSSLTTCMLEFNIFVTFLFCGITLIGLSYASALLMISMH